MGGRGQVLLLWHLFPRSLWAPAFLFPSLYWVWPCSASFTLNIHYNPRGNLALLERTEIQKKAGKFGVFSVADRVPHTFMAIWSCKMPKDHAWCHHPSPLAVFPGIWYWRLPGCLADTVQCCLLDLVYTYLSCSVYMGPCWAVEKSEIKIIISAKEPPLIWKKTNMKAGNGQREQRLQRFYSISSPSLPLSLDLWPWDLFKLSRVCLLICNTGLI